MRTTHAIPCLLALLGCAGERPRPQPVPTAPAPSASEASADKKGSPLVDVTVRATPADLRVDGALAEWGAVPAGDAPSQLSVSLEGDRLVLAASLREAARDGMWVAVSFGLSRVPQYGVIHRTNAGVSPRNCDDTQGKVRDACLETLKNFAEGVAAWSAPYTSVYRVSADGVELVSAGRAAKLDRDRWAAASSPEGVTVEATLPASFMPRADVAPIGALLIQAVAAGEPQPTLGEKARQALPAPVGLEPDAALRAAIFKENELVYMGRGPLLAYQPGERTLLETTELGDTFQTGEERLMSVPLLVHGGFELHQVATPGPAVAVMKNGELTDYIGNLGDVEPLAVVRGDVIHVLGYSHILGDGSLSGGAWRACSIEMDGTHKDLRIEGTQHEWDEYERFFADDRSTFGVRGTLFDDRTLEVTYRWDAKKNAYTATEKYGKKKP